MSEEKEVNKEMTDEELKQIAQDMVAGKVFTDRHIQQGMSPNMVFLPLLFLNEKQVQVFQQGVDDGRVFMIYEYMDKAGPRTMNGMPQFFSYRILNKEQTEKMIDYYEKIKKAIEEVK